MRNCIVLPRIGLIEEKNLLACLVQASTKSPLMKALTLTKSGLNGEVPRKENRAVTIDFAAFSRFAALSTTAIVWAEEFETS